MKSQSILLSCSRSVNVFRAPTPLAILSLAFTPIYLLDWLLFCASNPRSSKTRSFPIPVPAGRSLSTVLSALALLASLPTAEMQRTLSIGRCYRGPVNISLMWGRELLSWDCLRRMPTFA